MALLTVFGAQGKGDEDEGKGNGKGKKKSDKTGTYELEVRGYLRGPGTATVTGTTIKIDANVQDENGRRTNIKLEGAKIVKDRFTGQGTAFNQKVTISGRIDPPAGAVKVARITATYATANGRYGRISGRQK